MVNKPLYFSGLNGLRAIAAIAVVISHITLGLNEFDLNPHIFGTLQDGNPQGLSLAGYGVSIFFALSGFLITYLLDEEKEVKKNIDIGRFYLRRILRIWPLYYLYLLIAVLVMILYGLSPDLKSLSLYVFYAANIPFVLGTGVPFLTHYWSLGVEEQFYLFWPWFNKKISNYLISTIVFVILILGGAKIGLHFFYHNSLLETIIHVSRFHCMMIGALGAILYKRNNPLFLKITDNKISQGICWVIMFLLALNKFHLASVIDNEIISIVAMVLIIGQIRIKNRLVNLEINLFDFLGKVSYGIYVIHPLLIFLFSKIFKGIYIQTEYKYFIVYFVILATTILLAYLSYTYFERYFLNFKEKYIVIRSSATKHFETAGEM